MASSSHGRKRISRIQNESSQRSEALNLKLSLVSAVKKYVVIWKNFSDAKNQLLLEDAWKRVHKEIGTSNVEDLEKSWGIILRTYYYFKKGEAGVTMEPDLAQAMDFMDTELGFKMPESNIRRKPLDKKPKTTRVRKQATVASSRTPARSHARNKKQLSLAIEIIKYLYDTSEETGTITDGLLYATLQRKPLLKSAIVDVALEHYKHNPSFDNMDWTPLKTLASARICQALWDLKMKEFVIQGLDREYAPKKAKKNA